MSTLTERLEAFRNHQSKYQLGLAEKVEAARKMKAEGVMRKEISRIAGLSLKQVTKHTADIEAPFEHRGNKARRRHGVMYHREDYEE